MKLVRVDTVALGAFNPAIPSPAWYMRLGLLDAKSMVTTELALGFGGMPRHSAGGLRWSVLNEQFIVDLPVSPTEGASPDDVARPGEFLARTLEHLSHTPLSAVGNNFGFDLDEGNVGQCRVRGRSRGPCKYRDAYRTKHLAWRCNVFHAERKFECA